MRKLLFLLTFVLTATAATAAAPHAFTARDMQSMQRISEPQGSPQGDRIAFIVRTTELPDREAFKSWPLQPLDERRAEAVFGRAGLPPSVD